MRHRSARHAQAEANKQQSQRDKQVLSTMNAVFALFAAFNYWIGKISGLCGPQEACQS